MKIKNPGVGWCLFLLVLCISFGVFAEEQKSIDCAVKPYEGRVFQELYKSAAKTSETFCNELVRSRLGENSIDDKYIGSILKDFAVQSETALDNLRLTESADYKAQFNQLKTDFKEFSYDDMKMPEFNVRRSLRGG